MYRSFLVFATHIKIRQRRLFRVSKKKVILTLAFLAKVINVKNRLCPHNHLAMSALFLMKAVKFNDHFISSLPFSSIVKS